MLKNIAHISMYLSAIVGLIYLYKYKHTYLKYFLILLWFSILIEFIGKLYGRPNYIVYNIYHLINFSWLLLLFKYCVKEVMHKKIITSFILIYILSFFINIFFQDYFNEIQTIPHFIGSFFIIVSIFFYFSEILNTNKILYTSKYLLFWISIGLLMYYAGKTPTRIIKNYWDEVAESSFDLILFIDYILLIIMNLFFIIGFIFSNKDKQF